MAIVHCVVEELPTELVDLLARSLDFEQCLAYSNFGSLKHLLGTKSYWHNRKLMIRDRRHLHRVLSDENTKNARMIVLRGVGLDDTDVGFISKHFFRIDSIDLGHNPDISDESIVELLHYHGGTLKFLSLIKLFRLTNYTLERIAQRCQRLQRLDLSGGMYSACGLRELLINREPLSLRHLSLSRCHLIDLKDLPIWVEGMKSLETLDLSHLDSLQPYQIQEIVKHAAQLKRLDITGCPEFTLKAIRQLQDINPTLKIEHDARLEDHSIEGVRRFLLGLIAIQ